MPKSRPFEIRFWEKISKEGQNNDCWLWTAAKDPHGYGYFWIKDKMIPAPRASWLINIGLIPQGMHVLHHCDNPTCVNPNHLFLGNHSDNMRDAAQKGRMRHSEEHKQKMSASQIGKHISEEARNKMRLAKLGRTLSKETRQRMSESQLRRYATLRQQVTP